MPRFGLESEDDAAATTKHVPLTPSRARKVIRKKRVLNGAHATQEVEDAQILLETYLEDELDLDLALEEDDEPDFPSQASPARSIASVPPPLPPRASQIVKIPVPPPSSPTREHAPSRELLSSSGNASTILPPPLVSFDDSVESEREEIKSAIADIDQFLRTNAPKRLPSSANMPVTIAAPPKRPALPNPAAIATFQVPGLATPPPWQRSSWHDEVPPSVAPVAYSAMPATPPLAFAPKTKPKRKTGVVVTAVLLACGLFGGAAVPFLLPPGTVAKATSTVAALARRVRGQHEEKPNLVALAAQQPKPAEAPMVAPAPAPSPEPAKAEAKPMPSVPVDSLPKPKVDSKLTLVTLPSRARGHRVWVDRYTFSGSVSPAKMACGKHVVRVGSRGAPAALDFPCGGEITIR